MLRRSFVEEVRHPTADLWIVVKSPSARDFVFVAIKVAIIRRPADSPKIVACLLHFSFL